LVFFLIELGRYQILLHVCRILMISIVLQFCRRCFCAVYIVLLLHEETSNIDYYKKHTY